MSGNLAPYSLSELSLFVVSIITAAGGLCAVLGKIATTSRCKECKCCCIRIVNDPLDVEEIKEMNMLEPKQEEIKRELVD
tara:strand:- start:702 stop:941 length:240 start_codon:yes stop_codon:yes gene_type:complete